MILAKWEVKKTKTYKLFKTQPMLLSARSREDQWDADLLAVQNPEHDLVRNKQEGPARSWLTCCSKPRACSCQQQAGRARSWLTSCSKSRACSCQQQARRASQRTHPLFKTHQQQAGRASQILTYKLFKTQSMILSATSRKSQPDPDLLAVQTPEHVLVSNKQEGPARCWLTNCWKPRAHSCQCQRMSLSKILTYILFITQKHSC